MKYIIYSLLILFLASCGDTKWEAKEPEDVETMNSGRITYMVDESIAGVVDSTIIMYDKQYEKVVLTKKLGTSREVMGELLNGKVRAAITARGYLQDEDSLMTEYGVEKHKRLKAAIDALILVVNKDFPIDTLNAFQFKEILTQNKDFKDFFPEINSDVKYYSKDVNSSEWGNMVSLAANGEDIQKYFNKINSNDTLLSKALDANSLVVTYLSNIIGNKDVKALRMGYADSTGKYINPKPVHQGWIVQGLYPYKVDYWIYLLEDRQNLPYWFASFIAKETIAQKHFLDKGIVPAFAKIKLRPQD